MNAGVQLVGLGSSAYELAQQIMAQIDADDWSFVTALSTQTPKELKDVRDRIIAFGTEGQLAAFDAILATTNNPEIIEVIGTAPKRARPWWHYALGLTAVGGVGLLAYKAFNSSRPALAGPRTGPFYYLNYRQALRRAKRLADEIGYSVNVATGVDPRKPERAEYVVSLPGDSLPNYTFVAKVTRDGEVKSSGSRYHRMMERRGA